MSHMGDHGDLPIPRRTRHLWRAVRQNLHGSTDPKLWLPRAAAHSSWRPPKMWHEEAMEQTQKPPGFSMVFPEILEKIMIYQWLEGFVNPFRKFWEAQASDICLVYEYNCRYIAVNPISAYHLVPTLFIFGVPGIACYQQAGLTAVCMRTEALPGFCSKASFFPSWM